MSIDSSIYPSVYHMTHKTETDLSIEWSYPIGYLNYLGNLPYGEPWDGSNSYIGFDPTLKGNYVGATKHTRISLDPEDQINIAVSETLYKKQINYRMGIYESTSSMQNSPIASPYPVVWTNIISPWFESYAENTQTMPSYSVISKSNINTQLPGVSLSSNIYYTPSAIEPITKINKDAILLSLMINLLTYTPVYDSDGNITSFNSNIIWIPYKDIKPEDKTPAGSLYDEELWTKGFKDTIDEQTGRITKRVLISTCRVSRVWYGNLKHNEISSSTSSFDNITKRLNYFNFQILAEYYDDDRKAVVYEFPNGIVFDSGNVSNRYPDTPWTRLMYFNEKYNTVVTGYNPNIEGYYNSSTDEIGIVCDNSTNNLETSNTVIIPSNAFSSENTSEKFSNVYRTRYFFNTDGTISAYGYFVSSGRRYYQCECVTKCFPLKDLIATVASFGLFFYDSESIPTTLDLSDKTTYDTHLYRGNFDDNGVSDGTWWQGDDIPDKKLDEVDYKPVVPGGGGDEDVEDNTESGDKIPNQFGRTVGVTSNFITNYLMTEGQISKLGEVLWTSWADDTVTMDMVDNFYGKFHDATGSWNVSDALQFIVSCRLFPCSLATLVNTTQVTSIPIGTGAFSLQCGTSSEPNFFIANEATAILNCGDVYVPRAFNDYRDFENTKITAYLPFCGSVELNPQDVVGKWLGCTYAIDLFDGSCKAFIYTLSGNDVGYEGAYYNVAIKQGQCGFLIPLSATQAGQVVSRQKVDSYTDGALLFNAGMSVIGAALESTSGGSPDTGIMKAISTIGNYGFQSDILSAQRSGRPGIAAPYLSGGSGFTDFHQPASAYIQIRRSYYQEPIEYEHSAGYPVNAQRYGNLSQFSGFITCSNVDISGFTCHEDERAEIKALLESGVYL